MTEATIEEPIETNAEVGVDTPPAPEPTIDELIADYERATATPEPATDENPPSGGNSSDQTLDQLIAELSGPDPKLVALQEQIDGFRSAEFQRQERDAALKFAAELQDVVSRSNPNLEPDFVTRELKVMMVDNPGLLEGAWQHRNLSDADLAIAKRDLVAAQHLYQKVLTQPDTEPQKQNALRYLEQRGAQLQTMLGARSVIRNARNEIRRRADRLLPQIDPDVTATREEIAHLMKEGGSGRERPPEPPVQLGNLTDSEYRNYLKQIGISGF
jgi:hypothetical protein